MILTGEAGQWQDIATRPYEGVKVAKGLNGPVYLLLTRNLDSDGVGLMPHGQCSKSCRRGCADGFVGPDGFLHSIWRIDAVGITFVWPAHSN